MTSLKPLDQKVLGQSTVIHQQIWDQAVSVAETNPHSIMAGMFIESLNETIDLHTKRVFVGLYNRIPLAIWASLFFLIILGMTAFGYQAGIADTTRSLEMPLFAIAFAGVLYLIFDLDRSHEGFLLVNQQAMNHLYLSMQSRPPKT